MAVDIYSEMYNFDNMNLPLAVSGNGDDAPDPFAAMFVDALSAQSQSPAPGGCMVPVATPSVQLTPDQMNHVMLQQLEFNPTNVVNVQNVHVDLNVQTGDGNNNTTPGTMFQQAHGDLSLIHI